MTGVTRAERRRQLRDGGYKRAPGKKGRRPALRAPRVHEPVVSRLVLPTPELTERIARGQIRVPNLEELVAVNRGRR